MGLIDGGLNVPSGDVFFPLCEIFGSFPGSGVYDLPFGSAESATLNVTHQLDELYDPNYTLPIAAGTSQSQGTIQLKWAALRSRVVAAAMGGALTTSGSGAGTRTDLAMLTGGGPLRMALRMATAGGSNPPLRLDLYCCLATNFSANFTSRKILKPDMTLKVFVDPILLVPGKWSQLGDQTTDTGTIPDVPTGLTVVTAGTAILHVSWASMAGATSYDVFRCPGGAGGGPFTYIGNTTSTALFDVLVVTGTAYSYIVSSVNGSGESLPCGYVAQTAA